MTPPSPLDSQQTELLGTSILTASLVADGLEVAHPARDNGTDLLVYDLATSTVVPLQMKAATKASVTLDRKYEKIPALRLVFVWNVGDPSAAVIHALTYAEAIEVADEMGWTATPSWQNKDSYSTTRPSARLRDLLANYRVMPGGWRERLGLD